MNKTIKILVDDVFSGKEVKYFLKKVIGISDAIITDLKKTEEGILVNNERVFVTHILKAGDSLSINITDKKSDITESDIPLDIIFEDEDIIVLNKQRGVPTHPSLNHYEDTFANGLMKYYSGKDFTFRAVTRLDRDTSGVVIVAKNPFSGAILSENMKAGKIKKEYQAVINGRINPMSGVINAPIKRKYESMILRCVSPDGKTAITVYETLTVNDNFSLVRLNPITGRTHQLRVHLSHMGTPIYGDDLYGAPQTEESVRLHCRKVTLSHPSTGEEISFEADLPEDMKVLC